MECPACHTPNADGARFCTKCGALLPTLSNEGSDPLLGAVLGGRFRIVGVLGEGGMGRVYHGEQPMGTSVRKVAVKTLLAPLAKDTQVVARFMRECGTVSELEHPHTIKVYDFGQTNAGELYIAMELLTGVSLEKAIEAGPLTPDRIDKILGQVCGSLQEAHDKGIVHRDLKPANIYLTTRAGEEDYVKVLDFGIATRDPKHSKHEAKLTQQGTVLGTPPYMSPEQFRGRELDARSDIYSLGVMAYEMLTGRLPFDADTPWAWATQHMTAQPFPFETIPLGSAIPLRMKLAVMRALSKEAAHRQPSVREFYDEFTMGGGSTSAITGAPRPSGDHTALGAAALVPATTQTSLGGSSFSPPTAGFGRVSSPLGPSEVLGQRGPMPSSPLGGVPTAGTPIPFPSAPSGFTGQRLSSPSFLGGPPLGVPAASAQVVPPPPLARAHPKNSIVALLAIAAIVGVLVLVGVVVALKRHTGTEQATDEASATSGSASATKPFPPPEDAGAPDAATASSGLNTATPLPPTTPTTPPVKGYDPQVAQACKHAEMLANRNELGPARVAFARCEGPSKVGARTAIEQAEIRASHQHPRPPPCPHGKRCPR